MNHKCCNTNGDMPTTSTHTTSTHDALLEHIRHLYPNGSPDFAPIVLNQLRLHNDKNHDYAHGGDPLGNFKRMASILSLYPSFPYDTPEGVAFILALKQLDAEATAMVKGATTFKVEGYEGRTDDQAIYANLRQCIRAERRRECGGVKGSVKGSVGNNGVNGNGVDQNTSNFTRD